MDFSDDRGSRNQNHICCQLFLVAKKEIDIVKALKKRPQSFTGNASDGDCRLILFRRSHHLMPCQTKQYGRRDAGICPQHQGVVCLRIQRRGSSLGAPHQLAAYNLP